MANKTTYEIQAKTKGFDNSKTKVKGLNNALGGLATKAMTVAGAYFGGRALLDGINASIDAFAQQELAAKEAAIKSEAKQELEKLRNTEKYKRSLYISKFIMDVDVYNNFSS